MFKAIGKFIKLIFPENIYLSLKEQFLNFRKNWSLKSIRSRIKRYHRLAVKYPRIYRKYSSQPIDDNKILFIEPSHKSSSNYLMIFRFLSDRYNFDIHIHYLRHFFVSAQEYDKRCMEMLKDIATAKYVFIDEACDALSRILLREETIIAQTWHGCGAFKEFGFSVAEKIFGSDRKTLEKYPNYNNSFVTVSSPEVVWAYSEAMGLPEEKILPIGVSRTDIYFDENFKAAAKRKLEFFMPNSVGKKVILFAPTFRGSISKASTATVFSVARFYEELADDYVLIMKHHPYVKKPPTIPEKYQSFAVDFTNTMSIEELLCVADICISDYSSLIFECSLLEKPMIFFNYDIDEYFDWRGFYYNYDELRPGPSFQTNREMIEYIKNIDKLFDKQRVVDFKNKFMSSCDGHSTERLMDKVFGEDLVKHKKAEDSKQEVSVQVFGGPEVQTFEKWKGMKKLSAKEIKDRLIPFCPEIKGKKILAYFFTKRSKINPTPRLHFVWQDLFEDLDEQFVVLYRGVPKANIPKNFQKGRFIDVSDLLTEKELAVVADKIVTECNYAAGIYGCQKKPTFIYLPDYKWHCEDEEDYKNTTEFLRREGFFYEEMEDLIAAVQEEKPQTLQPGFFTKAFQEVCKHYN